MVQHICDNCGNVEKMVTPIMAYCGHCDNMRPVNIPPPVPIHVHVPPQPPPARQETDELGSEATCPSCGGKERKVTPITAVCQVCGETRSLAVKTAHDAAKDDAIRRELITVSQQLRARGVPLAARARMQERIQQLEDQLR